MKEEKKKVFEIDLTRQFFGLGLSWNSDYDTKFFAIVIGCLVFRFNWSLKESDNKFK